MIKIKLYTPKQAAKILELHPETVRKFLRQGKIKARKIGGWKITEEELQEFIKNPPQLQLDPDPEPSGYITTEEAADILGKGRRTIQDYCNQGKLEACKDGKGWKISKESVEEYQEAAKNE